tara:strand:- start:772 stop:2175 length:1404 start_codon:yes stop_codon:yes gene_type:complete
MHDLNENYVQGLKEKWAPVLDHEDQAPIKDAYRRNVTAILLENTEQAVRKENALGSQSMLSEADVVANVAPTTGALGGDGAIKYADPVMISMIRRTMPNLMAFDILGVQPMTGPTGLIFAMKSNYSTQGGTEALHDEADTGFSGADAAGNAHAGTDPFAGSSIASGGIVESAAGSTTGGPGTTAQFEKLGDGVTSGAPTADGHFNQMAFSIDRTSVTAKTRALKAEYTTELSQDLKAVHGLDAESELSTILSTEINAEINREVLRTLYDQAKLGCVAQTTTQGVYDLATDTSGRWTVEKIKGLIYQLEREANVIAKETRRGKGNMIVCSADVASALAMAGVLDNNPQMSVNLSSDDTGQTFAGVMNGRMRVYIDPYFNSAGAHDFAMVGYKGTSAYDAGYFYCPYVPMQMVRAVGENTFQPKIGFKTRYGMVANPFAGAARTAAADGAFPVTGNRYYRLIRIDNINV